MPRRHSCATARATIACLLFGSTKSLTADQLHALDASRQQYLAAYTKSVDAAINARFVLAADRAELLRAADPSRITG